MFELLPVVVVAVVVVVIFLIQYINTLLVYVYLKFCSMKSINGLLTTTVNIPVSQPSSTLNPYVHTIILAMYSV